jgi:hypothetical protein
MTCILQSYSGFRRLAFFNLARALHFNKEEYGQKWKPSAPQFPEQRNPSTMILFLIYSLLHSIKEEGDCVGRQKLHRGASVHIFESFIPVTLFFSPPPPLPPFQYPFIYEYVSLFFVFLFLFARFYFPQYKWGIGLCCGDDRAPKLLYQYP